MGGGELARKRGVGKCLGLAWLCFLVWGVSGEIEKGRKIGVWCLVFGVGDERVCFHGAMGAGSCARGNCGVGPVVHGRDLCAPAL